MALHLLRGFVQWNDRRPGCGPIKTIDEAEGWVRYIAGCGFYRFYTETARCPMRLLELEDGGSVYFVGGERRSQALFRMPIVEIEVYDDAAYGIAMRPELIRVRQDFVGRVRGWRYLKDSDAPPDLPRRFSTDNEHGDELPPELEADLKREGLL